MYGGLTFHHHFYSGIVAGTSLARGPIVMADGRQVDIEAAGPARFALFDEIPHDKCGVALERQLPFGLAVFTKIFPTFLVAS